MTPSQKNIYYTINMKLMSIFLYNIWLAIEIGLLIWFWYTTQRLYYISLACVDFLKFTRLIIYYVYLYFGDLKTILNKDKQPMKLKYHNMDYLKEENLIIALFDTFYCINVICLVGYIGSFIYGIIYQIMEGAIEMIILTMMVSLIEIFLFLIKFEERQTRQIKIDEFKNLIKYKGIDICVICLEDFQVDEKIGQELEELKCTGKHMFHKNCINAWLIYKKSCPLCNYKILINIKK